MNLLLRSFSVAALLAAAAGPALPQGLQSPDAIETIIGSDVREEEATATADADKVLAAIDRTVENTQAVRKLSSLDRVDIVFLTDAAATEGGPPRAIAERLERHRDEVTALRQEIEGNAMLYHAIDSRQVLVRDVVGIEFDAGKRAVIYAAAKPAG